MTKTQKKRFMTALFCLGLASYILNAFNPFAIDCDELTVEEMALAIEKAH